MTEAALATFGGVKCFHQIKFGLNDRNKHHLRDTFARFNGKTVLTTVPDRNHQLPLIIGINQPDRVAQHDTMFMAGERGNMTAASDGSAI